MPHENHLYHDACYTVKKWVLMGLEIIIVCAICTHILYMYVNSFSHVLRIISTSVFIIQLGHSGELMSPNPEKEDHLSSANQKQTDIAGVHQWQHDHSTLV